MNFIILVEQFITAFLMAAGLLFAFIEIRTKYDKSFLFFGGTLVFLCGIVGVDVWFFSLDTSPTQHLRLTQIQHVLACFFFIGLSQYIKEITNYSKPKLFYTIYASTFIMVLFLLSDYSMILENNILVTTPLYGFLFAPYFILFFTLIIFLILKGLRNCAPEDQKILRTHLVGIGALFIGGVVDIITMVYPELGLINKISYTMFGVLGFGLMASYIFAERFLMLLKEKQSIFNKLESTYKELEEASALKELGESSAIMSHQIRNYLHQVQYWSEMLKSADVAPKVMRRITSMIEVVDSMRRYAEDILNISRSSIVSKGDLINISQWLPEFVYGHFASHSQNITIEKARENIHLYLQQSKFEQVLINLIQNAIEATFPGEEPRIHIQLFSDAQKLVLSIEDYGSGCTQEQVDNMFKAFYTSKEKKKGTGLGLALVKNVINGHGGKIIASSKNTIGDGSTGMIFRINLPMYKEEKAKNTEKPVKQEPVVQQPKENVTSSLITLIHEGLQQPEMVQNVLRTSNSSLSSYSKIHDFIQEKPKGFKYLLTTPESFLKLEAHIPADAKVFLLSNHKDRVYIVEKDGKGNFGAFSEAYVLEHFK